MPPSASSPCPAEIPDEELVAHIRQRPNETNCQRLAREAAETKLARRYEPSLLGHAKKAALPHARDLVQSTWATAIKKLRDGRFEFRWNGSLNAWLHGILARKIAKTYRDESRSVMPR